MAMVKIVHGTMVQDRFVETPTAVPIRTKSGSCIHKQARLSRRYLNESSQLDEILSGEDENQDLDWV